jgi:hypothetical protein
MASRKAAAVSLDVNIRLQPKQAELLKYLQTTGHDCPSVIGFGGARGGAKALCVDTPIPVPSGWSTMGRLSVGDMVFSEDGSQTRITAATDIFTGERVRFTFSDGQSITCDIEHLWKTRDATQRMNNRRRTSAWRESRRLRRGGKSKPWLCDLNTKSDAVTDSILTAREIIETFDRRHSITVCGPVQGVCADLPIDPYCLGAWLGDGTSAGGSMTSADPEIIQQFANSGYEITRHRTPYGYGILGLSAQLHALGLKKNKHIPPVYLRASVDQRIALLQGLMDTDGCCGKGSGAATFDTTSRAIADGILELILSLGIKAASTESVAMLYGRPISAKYRIKFRTALPVFRLRRKAERQKREGFNGTHQRRWIDKIEYVGPGPVRCITVAHESGMFLAGRNFCPTHNSGAVRRIALAEGFRINGVNSCIVRRVFPDVRENHIERMRQEYPQLEQYYKATDHEYALPNGTRIGFWYAENHMEVQRKFWGPEFRLIFVDQAEQFTEQELVTIRTSCRWPNMPPGANKMVLLFNPGGTGTQYLRRIFHLKQYNKGERASDYAFIQAYGWDNHVWFAGQMDIGEQEFYALPGECEAFPDEQRMGPRCCRYHMFIHDTQYGRELNSLPPGLRAGHLLGSFDSFAGQYFAGVWDESKTVISPVDAERIIQPWWKRWAAVDWGFAHYASVGWYATGKLSPGQMLEFFGVECSWPVDVVIKYRELVVNQTGEGELAGLIVEHTPERERKSIGDVFLSPDAWAQRGSANTVAETMGDVLGSSRMPRPEPADNDRVGGWRFMWGCLKQTCSMRAEVPIMTGGFPMFLVSAECPETIMAIPLATRNDRQAGKIEDVLKTDTIGDDVIDETRYGLKSKLSPRSSAPSEVRFAEATRGMVHPNQIAMAARVFGDRESKRKVAGRPRWRG